MEIRRQLEEARGSDIDPTADLDEAYRLWSIDGLKEADFARPNAFMWWQVLRDDETLRRQVLTSIVNKHVLKDGMGGDVDESGEVVEDSGLDDLESLAEELAGG